MDPASGLRLVPGDLMLEPTWGGDALLFSSQPWPLVTGAAALVDQYGRGEQLHHGPSHFRMGWFYPPRRSQNPPVPSAASPWPNYSRDGGFSLTQAHFSGAPGVSTRHVGGSACCSVASGASGSEAVGAPGGPAGHPRRLHLPGVWGSR